MKLTHSCIITEDVKKLSEFYENVLQIEAQLYGEDYAEFEVGNAKLAIFDLKSHESSAPNSAKPALNKSMILEFHVEDVDIEYARLNKMEINWVKSPTTQSWGNKSMYFRDLDGNMISFYSDAE
ncbi:VOC family protein [Sporosalibacterium faouarense]|uniref:VOC family protein n=1 Tax=Sporosalibacterium faouarense TaxID=516123 RepID=UPI00141C186C|nr:VOC family protein [Sporosalibacterium faouarense]MTI46303.1 VOC family protein [Bacillota bacterium]